MIPPTKHRDKRGSKADCTKIADDMVICFPTGRGSTTKSCVIDFLDKEIAKEISDIQAFPRLCYMSCFKEVAIKTEQVNRFPWEKRIFGGQDFKYLANVKVQFYKLSSRIFCNRKIEMSW